MKRKLILLFLLVPLLANGQYWYTANAMRFKYGNELEEWQKCNLRVFIDKKNNVTIYGSNDNIELRSVNDDYKLKEDSEGNSRLSWVCVDDEGKKCMPILISDKAVTFIYLAIHYPDKGFAIFYNLVPDRS